MLSPTHRVSITTPFKWGNSSHGASILALSHCVFLWKLLYLNVRPLGLQGLHAGQNLLLVAGKIHPHFSQFTF